MKQVTVDNRLPLTYNGTIARPRVIIPVFPGTNCEYDSARAFEQAGAVADTLVINNLTPSAVAESTKALVEAIKNSQIIMLPGGFSGGDEPDGSAKFITAFFRAPEVTEAVRDLLFNRDGLMLGICNGFQALVKLGLVPYGDIRPMDDECPTLTFNTIGRHQSRLVRTRVASNLSPRGLSQLRAPAISIPWPLAMARAASCAAPELQRPARGHGPASPRSTSTRPASPAWIGTSTPTAPSWPSRASPAPTAACSARWATWSVAATVCTRTSRATSSCPCSKAA